MSRVMEFKGSTKNWEFRKWEGEQWPEKRFSVGEFCRNGKAICISPRYPSNLEELEANFKLIAASKDLLEVGKELTEFLSWLQDNAKVDEKLHETYANRLMNLAAQNQKTLEKALK